MSLLITIFGGMLLTAVLYAVGRLARLSNFWAAVIAAAVPTFGYLIYAISHPVGLDVVTMHIIAYPTVAVLLGMPNSPKAKREGRMHWAPKLLIGFFLLLMVVMGNLVYIAKQGLPPAVTQLLLPNAKGKTIHTGFAGVVEHQEDAAKGIGPHLNMTNKLARLGWHVEVDGLAELHAGDPAPISVHIIDATGRPVAAVAVTLALNRPGQPSLAKQVLSGAADGYHGTLQGLAAGVWVANLQLAQGQDTIVLEHSLEVR
ncbi:MAG: FixH family protein [Gallionellaceae bacterium]|nr:FixH family protein [Gallionellaceae bacterium]MDD5364226.1 FixH family protein [Gallionellaceae bacterium]